MYLGRENLGTKKNPEQPIRAINYSGRALHDIESVVNQIKKEYPEFNDIQARIWEILSRYRGDAGLSAGAVSYLASCLYQVFQEEK